MEMSSVVKHAWENRHPMHREKIIVLDYGGARELLVKEALYIQITPLDERFN